jgi:nucleotide-binding universal stress UspA family protein
MFRKILICSDTSPASDVLIRCIGELKTIGLEEAVLAHVHRAVHPNGLDELLSSDAQSLLTRQQEELERMGIRVITETPVDFEPARALADLAAEHDVSAVFIGSHGKGIIRSAVLGSVTAKLLQHIEKPVLLVRVTLLEEGTCQTLCRKMFTSVLFPTDFSEAAEQALIYLGKIAADTECPVTILHVIEEKPADNEAAERMMESARFLIEAKKRRLESLGASAVNSILVSGEPAKEILATAKEGDFSLIVMGSTGKGLVKGVLLGSVSNEVTRHADVPVLLIPSVR